MKVNDKPCRTINIHPADQRIVQIIDQRHLPHRFVIEELTAVDEFAAAIKEMHVRGAGLIGATAGFGVYCAAINAPDDPVGFSEHIENAAQKLKNTRPTASNLAWAVERMKKAMDTVDGVAAKRERALLEAQSIADEDADFCKRIGEHGVEIIREISKRKQGQPVNILTHCNAGWLAFVDYGSATAPIYEAHAAGIPVHVWVDETRPWLQGSKLTAWELAQEGVPHTLIADNTGGHLMQHKMVDMVITGTDRTTRCGDVANKIGTYLKALAAYDNQVPFYVALPSSTFDWNICDGIKDIPIEERAGEELCLISGKTAKGENASVAIAPEGCVAANYGFDVTPARLITGLISERGIMKPQEEDILRLYPEQRR